jgi:hypothetical protein
MAKAGTIRHAVAAAAALMALSVGTAQANDTVSFRDVLNPHGHARSKSEKLADGRACGATGPAHTIRVTSFPVASPGYGGTMIPRRKLPKRGRRGVYDRGMAGFTRAIRV